MEDWFVVAAVVTVKEGFGRVEEPPDIPRGDGIDDTEVGKTSGVTFGGCEVEDEGAPGVVDGDDA